MKDIIGNLHQNGHALLANALDAVAIQSARTTLDSLLEHEKTGILRSQGTAYGVRNLLQLWPAVCDLVRRPSVRELVQCILGPHAGIVRALYFDKPPGRSWTLPWHRDRTIAVGKIPPALGPFRSPTYKAGIPHLSAPNSILSGMLTLRFALDPMGDENGPLVVLPGSHNVHSEQDDEDLQQFKSRQIETIHCQAGDLFVMRPLLAHSSLKSSDATQLRRRTIHLELTPEPKLPNGVVWHDFHEVGT